MADEHPRTTPDAGEAPTGYASWDQQPAVGRRGLIVMTAIVLLITALGGGAVWLVGHDSESQATAIKVPTSNWIDGQDVGPEVIRGELSVDGRNCVYLSTDDGDRVWTVWPAGYYARMDGAGHLSLYDGTDRLVARAGEELQANGSYGSAAGYIGESCLPSNEDVALVQSKVTRVD